MTSQGAMPSPRRSTALPGGQRRYGYRRLSGEELEGLAHEVARFVRYTGAGGIYPIGMEHAAPSAVRHEPDSDSWKWSDRSETGRYVPFAQHGGTGARGC